MKAREAGSALALALIVVILLAGMAAALATVTIPYINRTANLDGHVRASYAGEAALEKVWYDIAASGYTADGNVWLMGHSAPPPAGFLAYSDMPVGDARVDVRVFSLDLENEYYRVEGTVRVDGLTVTLAQGFRARDTFARYMFFVDQETISFGASMVRGYIHDNKGIGFNFGGAKFYKEVDAVQGFTFSNGATRSNTTFYGGSNPSASYIQMPSTSEIATLHNDALPDYKFNGANDIVTILLQGDKVRLTARNQVGRVISDRTLPLPDNGLIFVQGNVVLKGDLSGRLTVATMGKVEVNDRIRYKDSRGNLAWQLMKNGAPVPNNDAPQGVAWNDSTGYAYVPNPAYEPDSDAPPALGILAQNNVTIAKSSPWNMELHAAIYSSQGNWNCDLSQSKGNIRVNGSLVSRKAGWRYSTSNGGKTWTGWGASGEYIYDDSFLNRPPPFFLKTDKPLKGSRWKMNVAEVTR